MKHSKILFKSTLNLNIVLLSVLTFLSVQCSQRVPDATQNECEAWFIDPSKTLDQAILQIGHDGVTEMLGKACKYGPVSSIQNSVRLIDTVGTEYICGFQTPAVLEKDKRYPLIIYLHGGTGTTLNSKGELAYEMLKPLTDSMPIILASPSASRSSQWWTPIGLSRMFQTLRYMSLYYPVDPTKIFLAGVSDGASGCYAVANVAPFPFAGFIAVSGYGGIIASNGMKVYPENIRQRPIYNINAGQDRLYSLDIVNDFVDYLEQNGAQIIRKIYPEEQHGFDYREKEYGTLLTFIRIWKKETFKGNLWNFVQGYPNFTPFCMNWEYAQSQGNPLVSTYISGDTLVVRSNGLKKFIVCTQQPSAIRHAKCNQTLSKPDFITGKELTQLKINYLKYSCSSVIPECSFLKIEPK
jgi:hypothetical protein